MTKKTNKMWLIILIIMAIFLLKTCKTEVGETEPPESKEEEERIEIEIGYTCGGTEGMCSGTCPPQYECGDNYFIEGDYWACGCFSTTLHQVHPDWDIGGKSH